MSNPSLLVRLVAAVWVLIVWALPWSLGAAAVDDGATLPPPAQASAYELHADAQWQYDDNVYKLPSGQDLSLLVGPGSSASDHTKSAQIGADGHWAFGQQSLDFALEAARSWYSLNTNLDNTQGNARAIFNLQLTSLLSLQTGEIYSRTLANFAYTGAYLKDLISSSETFLAGRLLLAPRWTVFGGARFGESSHSASEFVADRFHRKSANVGLQYAIGATNWVGAEYRYSDGHFKVDQITEIDGLPFKRNYKEYTERLLLHYAPSTRITVDLDGGYLKRTYPDSLVGDFSGNTFRGSMRFDLTAKTQLVVTGYKDLRAYVEAESNYFVAKGASVSPVWNITERISLSAQYSYENQHFVGSEPTLVASETRHDILRSEQVGLTYSPRERFSLLLSYQRSSRSSSLDLFDFTDRLFMVNVTTRPWMH